MIQDVADYEEIAAAEQAEDMDGSNEGGAQRQPPRFIRSAFDC
jgi:hypothetical protein